MATRKHRARIGGSKLTPETVDRVCAGIAAGLSIERASRRAGISSDTFYRWRKRGENAKTGKHREFVDRLDEARAEFMATHVAVINAAATAEHTITKTMTETRTDPEGNETVRVVTEHVTDRDKRARHSQWMLARHFPDLFGTRVQTENTHQVSTDGTPAPFIIGIVPTDNKGNEIATIVDRDDPADHVDDDGETITAD